MGARRMDKKSREQVTMDIKSGIRITRGEENNLDDLHKRWSVVTVGG